MSNLEKVKIILTIIGSIVVGLPPLLHALRAFLKFIPGDPGDSAVGWLEDKSSWLASQIVRVLPASAPKPPTSPAA